MRANVCKMLFVALVCCSFLFHFISFHSVFFFGKKHSHIDIAGSLSSCSLRLCIFSIEDVSVCVCVLCALVYCIVTHARRRDIKIIKNIKIAKWNKP